jgi:L-ascorbate metabolism protein UlaG (beta-lactamase superfamily)
VLFAKTDWKVAGPNDVIASVPAHRVVPLSEPRTTFGPIEIEPIATPHADVGHYSYIVTWHGKRLYFSGDTESSASLLAAKNLDVAFVSPWVYRAVVRNNHLVDARRIVIYHHEAGERIPECREPCLVPRHGQTISIH